MSHTDKFEDFIIQPVSRIIIDLAEAMIEEDLPYTPRDAYAKQIINKTIGEFKGSDLSEQNHEKYKNYLTSLDANRGTPPTRAEVAESIELKPVDKSVKIDRITMYQPAYFCSQEIEEYIDMHYYPQEVPVKKGYFFNNNGWTDHRCGIKDLPGLLWPNSIY